MDTLAGAGQAIETALLVLQDILTEEVLAFFTEPYSMTTEKSGRRLLEIGPLLYSRPSDALHISLWEAVTALYPDAVHDQVKLKSLFRPGAWEMVESVTSFTTWDELEEAVGELGVEGEEAVAGKPHLVVWA